MKKINVSELCWWLLMGALVIIIGKIILLDELKFYLHPKVHPFVIFGEIILIILFVYQQKNIFSTSNKRFKVGYFVFLIPMFMFIMAGDASAIIFKNRTIGKNDFLQSKQPAIEKQAQQDDNREDTVTEEKASPVYDMLPEGEVDNPDPNATDPTDEGGIADSSEHIPQTEIKILNDDPFLTTLYSIDPEKENEVTLEGFVFRNEFFAENEFYISRFTTNCCVAEAIVIGMVVRSQVANSFKDDEWVRVKGITKKVVNINPDTNEEVEETILEAVSIERIEPLESPYVYFSF